MKRVAVATVALLALTSLTLGKAAVAATDTMGGTVTLRGAIIDSACAGSQTPAQLDAFIKTHTKDCALMPGCAASGYNIFADGKLYKFDKGSSARVEEFLRKADSKLDVVVVGREAGGTLELISIENQR